MSHTDFMSTKMTPNDVFVHVRKFIIRRHSSTDVIPHISLDGGWYPHKPLRFCQLCELIHKHRTNSLVLKLHQVVVDLLKINLDPGDVVVAINLLQHLIVEGVQLLEQVQLLANLLQLRILRHRQSKQCLAARVRLVFVPKFVKLCLEDGEAVRRLTRGYAVNHWSPGKMTSLHVI